MSSKSIRSAYIATLLFLQILWTPGYAAVSRDDNSPLTQKSQASAYVWRDDEAPPKAAVIIVHGFTQQGRSVETLASDLAKDRYLVVSIDQRGHGRWHYGKMDAPEEFQTAGETQTRKTSSKNQMVDYEASVADITRIARELKEEHPGLPIYGIGESAGAGIVAEAASKPESGINGVVLCSAGRYPRIYNVFWVVRDFLCNIYRLNHPINLRGYIKTYASNDPRVVQEMLSQPLDRNDLTGREILRTMQFIKRTKASLRHMSKNVPLLVLQGKQDHIVQGSSAIALVKSAPAKDKSLLLFPEYGHVLVGTNYIQPRVSAAIKNWLDARIINSSTNISSSVTDLSASTEPKN